LEVARTNLRGGGYQLQQFQRKAASELGKGAGKKPEKNARVRKYLARKVRSKKVWAPGLGS